MLMIDDSRTEGEDMETRVGPKPESPPLTRQMCFGLILRALRVWVPKRIIPRLGALSVVTIRAKQSQEAVAGGQ